MDCIAIDLDIVWPRVTISVLDGTIGEMDKATFIQKARELEPEYVPNPAVLQQLSGLTLVAIIGATGVGKSTLIAASGIHYVRSDMTRTLRDSEQDGVDINQRSDYDKLWEELDNGLFVQFLISHTGEFYGTRAESYPVSGVCTMPIVTSAFQAFEQQGFGKIIKIYVVPPSYDVWQQRIASHGITDIDNRMVEARESFANALKADDYNFIINDDVNLAVQDIHDIISGTYPADKAKQSERVATEIATCLV